MRAFFVRADVIVIGLGHAGCEAALACARTGLHTVGVTLAADRIAVMSCNPAIGGTAKGHLVRELDALGGEMAFAADQSGTHFITLNASKGAAVQATRVLCNRDAYARAVRATIASQPNLEVVESEVSAVLAHDGAISGVRLKDGRELQARAVIVTTGTFLQALMHVGDVREVGGRLGDGVASGLSTSLRELGFELRRFKTGTPARLKKSSIDFSRCQLQPGVENPLPFSLRTSRDAFPKEPRVDCYVTFTNEKTHQVLRGNLSRSPLYQGQIVGRGPRYCPSVEDKVVRFAQKSRHTVFLEPEGPTADIVYPAGLSTSLPVDVQLEFLRTIEGLERVEVLRYGYAVEYDYAPPTQLQPTLETQRIRGLYFAGQLNGTSGYEEAALQGLLAGINASLALRAQPPLVLGRHEAHGGVLIDELVTRGVDEPFRMMTSRSEHRLKLREGNAQFRLRHHGHRAGLVSEEQLQQTTLLAKQIAGEMERLTAVRLLEKLRQPEHTYASLAPLDLSRPELSPLVVAEVETSVKYAGYIAQAQAQFDRRADAFDGWSIPNELDFATVRGLSAEAQERLQKARPATVGTARKLPGITPAAMGLLLVHLRRFQGFQS